MYNAFNKAFKGKTKKNQDAIEFSMDLVYNINMLISEIENQEYRFSGYHEFMVYEPKERTIHAPHFRDKVVQLAIYEQIKHFYFDSFIYDSYACIDGKGTHSCALKINDNKYLAKKNYGDSAYVLSMDIKRFFYSIDRDVLKIILQKKIKSNKILMLLYIIIDSADSIGYVGLPLGNTLSQLFANTYLNELDQYIKRNLRVKYYTRYADDLCLILENKDVAIATMESVIEYTEGNLNLEFNKDKTHYFPITNPINTVGYKIFGDHMLLRNDSKSRIKRKMRKIDKLYERGLISNRKFQQIIDSWQGHADIANSRQFINKLVSRRKYIEVKENKIIVRRI